MARRLAAILAADAVGYSRLMDTDEAGALEALRTFRAAVFDPIVARHGGRVFKLMGDGALVEFASAVQAVAAARSIQREQARTGDAIRLRIGINLGEVIPEGDDLYGNGVNVAVRLEALAAPGGICISSAVRESLGDDAGADFRDSGAHRVKGIGKPVRVWRWPDGPGRTGEPEGIAADKPSVAVLPFTNVGGDPAQEHVADGITEDLITALGRCRWLFVIARNSTFAFKGRSEDVRMVSRELGARYVLEGSVRRAGSRIRVNAALSDGRDGTRLWGERYDREIDDIFALQDEIASVIAGTIEPEIESIGLPARARAGRSDVTAWEFYQRGLWHLYRFSAEDLAQAKALFERAAALDPGFSQAYARLGYVQVQLGWYGPRAERAARARDAVRLAAKAVEIDGRDPSARLSLGRGLMLSGRMESGIEELRAAVALDPSFAQAHFALAQALTGVDRHDEALREIAEAIRLSPRDPHMWTFLHIRAIAHYIAGDMARAEADERAALREPNVTFYPYTLLVAIHGRTGKAPEAADAIAELLRLKPGFTCAEAIEEWHFGEHPVMTARFIGGFAEDLRRAGLPG